MENFKKIMLVAIAGIALTSGYCFAAAKPTVDKKLDEKVNPRSFNGETELYKAVAEENENRVAVLLDAGADPNKANWFNGKTPLHKAVRMKNYDILKMLLDKGADVTITNKKHETALHIAVEDGWIGGELALVDHYMRNGIEIPTSLKDGLSRIIELREKMIAAKDDN